MLQHRFDMEKCFEVPPECFNPAPKVDSAIVRMVPLESAEADDEALFSKIVAAAFSQRRKTLRNTLKGMLGEADFKTLSIDPQARAENLSISEFANIANYLEKK